MKSSLGILLLLVSVPAFASLNVRSTANKSLDVAIVREPFTAALQAIQPYLPQRVDVLIGNSDPLVTCRANHVAPLDALRALVAAAHLELVSDNSGLWVRDAKEPSVTIDVKDADVRTILTSMQRQCGIRNLMIDPDVQGKGTFLFRNVPCQTAFATVFKSLGLTSTTYDNSVIAVNGRSR